MVEKEKAEVIKEEEIPVITQAIEPTADEIKQKMVELETQLVAAKTEAKSHQEYGRKQREELEKQRRLEERFDRLEAKEQIRDEMTADILDRLEQRAEVEEEEKPKQRRSEPYRSKLAEAQGQEQKKITQGVRETALEADRLLKSIGLQMRSSPETLEAYALFTEGNTEAGLEEVKRIVASKTEAEKPKETPDQTVERLVQEKFQKMLKDKGLDKVDTGIPSAGSLRFEEVRDRYIENPGDVKNTTEYYRLRREKGI